MSWREELLPRCWRGDRFEVARKIQDLHPLSSMKVTAFDCLPPNLLVYEATRAKLRVGVHAEDLTWTIDIGGSHLVVGSIKADSAPLNHVLAALAELTEAFV